MRLMSSEIKVIHIYFIETKVISILLNNENSNSFQLFSTSLSFLQTYKTSVGRQWDMTQRFFWYVFSLMFGLNLLVKDWQYCSGVTDFMHLVYFLIVEMMVHQLWAMLTSLKGQVWCWRFLAADLPLWLPVLHLFTTCVMEIRLFWHLHLYLIHWGFWFLMVLC